jgi:hypothetical protein
MKLPALDPSKNQLGIPTRECRCIIYSYHPAFLAAFGTQGRETVDSADDQGAAGLDGYLGSLWHSGKIIAISFVLIVTQQRRFRSAPAAQEARLPHWSSLGRCLRRA